MRTHSNFTLALTFVAIVIGLFIMQSSLYAVPITGGTGPGGVEFTDGTSDLQLWLKSDAGILENDAVGRVSGWENQSGYAGRDATQTTLVDQPSLVAGPNGQSVLLFGTADIRKLEISNFLSGFSEAEAFWVFRTLADPPANATIAGGFHNYGTISNNHHTWSADGIIYDNFGSNVRKTTGNPATDLSTAFRTYDVSSTAGDWTSRIDGNIHFNTATNTVAFTAGTVKIGEGELSGERQWDGLIAEHIFFDRVLSSIERTLVDNYLAAKYGTTTATDVYSGDDPTNGNYDSDVFGIGQLDGVAFTSSGSAGFGIEAISGLDNDDEFMLAGHKVASNTQLDNRWDRTWFLDNRLGGNESLTLAFDWSDAGLGTADPEFLELMFSSSDGGPFTSIAVGVLSADTVTFASLLASDLDKGYYTLGVTPVPEPSSLLLLGLGALGMMRHTRRRRHNASTSCSNSSTNLRSETMKTRGINSQTWTRTLTAIVMLGTFLFANLSAHAVLIGSSAANPAISAKQILDYGASLGDGVYWMDPDGSGGNAPFQAYADMTTDGGGWTLMTFAGTIPTTKTALAGANNWFPVFNNFGTYDPNALTSGNAFSRRDMVDSLFQDSSQILSYRASNLNNQMIFPVADRTSWLGGILPDISYLTLTNDGSTYVTHPGSELAVYNQGTLPRYTGYDWNVIGNNSDGFGSYATALNHRSLLYWENLDGANQDQQWFHASPLTLAPSTGPFNDVQDIAFLLREDVTYTPPVPEPSSLLLLGLGLLGLVRHTRRRRRRA